MSKIEKKTAVDRLADALKEAVANNDEGLIDAVTQDYERMVAWLASSKQYKALSECLSTVGNANSITTLIGLKTKISRQVLTKALCLCDFYIGQLPSKEVSRSKSSHDRYYSNSPRPVPPNADQSMAIAKAITISRRDNLSDMVGSIKYFSKLGHQQAVSIILDHYLKTEMYKKDGESLVFAALCELTTASSLHPSIIKILTANESTWSGQCRQIAKEWMESKTPWNTSRFSIGLLEAFHAAGFQTQAIILGEAYDALYAGENSLPEPCVGLRLRNLGVATDNFVQRSRSDARAYTSRTPQITWLEDLITNDRYSPEDVCKELAPLELRYSKSESCFLAVQRVLEFFSGRGKNHHANRKEIYEKSAALCAATIVKIGQEHDRTALRKIIETFKLPNEVTTKVKVLKGLVLENDLGI